jgi:hypothetical protein
MYPADTDALYERMVLQRYIHGLDVDAGVLYIRTRGDACELDVIYEATRELANVLMGKRIDTLQRARWNQARAKVRRLVFLLTSTGNAFHEAFFFWAENHGDAPCARSAPAVMHPKLLDDPSAAPDAATAQANAASATQGESVAQKRAEQTHHTRISYRYMQRPDSRYMPLVFLRSIHDQQVGVGKYLEVSSAEAAREELARCVVAKKDGLFRRPHTRAEIVASTEIERPLMDCLASLLTDGSKWSFVPRSGRTEAENVRVLQSIAPAMGLTHVGLIRTATKGPWETLQRALRAIDTDDFEAFGVWLFSQPWELLDVYSQGTRVAYGSAENLGTFMGCLDVAYQAYTALADNSACELAFAGLRNESVRRTVDV